MTEIYFHNFDADGYYAGSALAPVNPVTGKVADINPDAATRDALPDHDPATQRCRWVSGAWAVEEIPEPDQPQETEQVSVDNLRAAARSDVDSWRSRKEQQVITFEHAGRVWDGGLTTRQRLKPVLSLSELPTGFFWTDHDNNDVPVTIADLLALDAAHEAALVSEGFRIHIAQRQMKTAIAAMSREQLMAFDPENWMNQ
jgi:hypothetical protein